MSCVPSSAATAASKRRPSRSPLDALATDAPWTDAVDAFALRHPRRLGRLADYQQLLEDGAHSRVADAVLAGAYRPSPPVEAWLNKADGRKKRIFQYPPVDELLFRVVNHLLQPAAVDAASPWCRSFLPGCGPRTAFRAVLRDPEVASKAALRLDIRDYFNSIDVDDLLAALPPEFGDGALGALLRSSLLDPRVVRMGMVVDGSPKGIMAGTPIAPMLATLYLRDLDHEVAATGATYARYSDDILALAPEPELPEIERLLRTRLCERGLLVNEGKSSVAAAGAAWDFLGFRYEGGTIGVAPATARKLKARTTRLARSLLRWRERKDAEPTRTLAAFLRRTNRRLFGAPVERADFSWATWFLPMLDRPDGLAELDAHVQREARYAATGRRTPRTKSIVPYAELLDAGHVPLVTAYWAMNESVAAYDALIARRAGLG
jgi:hypothetical protein